MRIISPRIPLAVLLGSLAACHEVGMPFEGDRPVSGVRVSPGEFGLVVGQTQQLAATATDANGGTISGLGVQWQTNDTTVATVSSSGLVRAVGKGNAVISATISGRRGSAGASVRRPVVLVSIEPTAIALAPGESWHVTAIARDAAGEEVLGNPTTWVSSAPAVASLSGSGPSVVLTAVSPGFASITATVENHRASLSVTVSVGSAVDPTGLWDWTERIVTPRTGMICSDTGTYAFTRSGSSLGGTFNQVGTCSTGVHPIIPNQIFGGSISTGITAGGLLSFVVGSGSGCTYSGIATGSPAVAISGTVICADGTASGTWSAMRGLPITSLGIDWPFGSPLLVGEKRYSGIKLFNSAGQRAFGRPVAWSSSDASVLTVVNDGPASAIVHGAAVGQARVTASVESTAVEQALTVRSISFATVEAGGDGGGGITTEGETFGWGDTPQSSGSNPRLVSLSVGPGHSCGLTADGVGYCWGDNTDGQLGALSGPDPLVQVSGGLRFAWLSAGGTIEGDYYGPYYSGYTCGVTLTGEAYCWGYGAFGRLGGGSFQSSRVPRAVAPGAGLLLRTVSTGATHTCGLTQAGQAYCWGDNSAGQLGNPSVTTASPLPVPVSGGLTFTAIQAGGSHTCGLTLGGLAYCWGLNQFGQLGSPGVRSQVPVRVEGGLTFSALAIGLSHSCALTPSGTGYCWGNNSFGQLGSELGSTSSARAVAGGLTFTSIRSGNVAQQTCGMATDGRAYCWGMSWALGAGENPPHNVPVRVLGQP